MNNILNLSKVFWYRIEGRLYTYTGEADNDKYIFHAVYSDDVFELSEYEIVNHRVHIEQVAEETL